MKSVLIFHYHLLNWYKLQIHAVGGPSDFVCVYIGYQTRSTHDTAETVKIEPHKFCHLNKIYQKHLFLFGKIEKQKIAVCIVFFQARKLLQ